MPYRLPGSRNTFGPIPGEDERKMMATVVHRAICSVIGPESASRSTLHYPVVAAAVAGLQTGALYEVRAGDLRIRPYPDAPWFKIGAADPAPNPHVWLVREHTSGKAEIVDLTSRYWEEWLTVLGAEWQRRRPIPWYFWEWEEEIPRYIRFQEDPAATAAVQEDVYERQRILMRPAITAALGFLKR
jgi:hypothetical protein